VIWGGLELDVAEVANVAGYDFDVLDFDRTSRPPSRIDPGPDRAGEARHDRLEHESTIFAGLGGMGMKRNHSIDGRPPRSESAERRPGAAQKIEPTIRKTRSNQDVNGGLEGSEPAACWFGVVDASQIGAFNRIQFWKSANLLNEKRFAIRSWSFARS
jgi:hypothetical protein